MSLSSVTTKTENLMHLGYPEGVIMNEYYSARADEGHGFCVAYMVGEVVIDQLNPNNVLLDPDASSYDPAKWNEVFVTSWTTPDDIEVLYGKADADVLRQRELMRRLRHVPVFTVALTHGVTFGWGVGDRQTWPALLQKSLGLAVRNASVPGYTTWQGARVLDEVTLPERPRVVMLCHGVNDVSKLRFFGTDTKGALKGSDIDLGSSWGVAAHAGLDFAVTDKSAVRVDVRWADIDSKVKLDGAKIGTANIDPMVYGVAYVLKF